MVKVIIYKDKITTTEWQEKEQNWVEYDISKLDAQFTKYFNRIVEIKEGVTVEDFMNHLEKYEPLIDLCFAGFMNDVPLRPFLDEMKEDVENKTDIEEVEMAWEGEILNEDMAIIGYLRGWLTDKKIEEIGQEFDVPHDLGLLPISVYKKCQLNLNENIVINDLGKIEDLKKIEVFDGFYSWTLHEVIANFLSDLTLNGSPEERNKLAEELQTKKFDVKEVSRNKDQAEFWLSFLQAELNDLNYAIGIATEEENYEQASKLKKDIDAVEAELKSLEKEIENNGE